jgi:hypothetical protein
MKLTQVSVLGKRTFSAEVSLPQKPQYANNRQPLREQGINPGTALGFQKKARTAV